jgi:hypothetical protein
VGSGGLLRRPASAASRRPDFTPLDFRQRFTGTFSEDLNTISGAWEKAANGGGWEHDFTLTYRRAC